MKLIDIITPEELESQIFQRISSNDYVADKETADVEERSRPFHEMLHKHVVIGELPREEAASMSALIHLIENALMVKESLKVQ